MVNAVIRVSRSSREARSPRRRPRGGYFACETVVCPATGASPTSLERNRSACSGTGGQGRSGSLIRRDSMPMTAVVGDHNPRPATPTPTRPAWTSTPPSRCIRVRESAPTTSSSAVRHRPFSPCRHRRLPRPGTPQLTIDPPGRRRGRMTMSGTTPARGRRHPRLHARTRSLSLSGQVPSPVVARPASRAQVRSRCRRLPAPAEPPIPRGHQDATPPPPRTRPRTLTRCRR